MKIKFFILLILVIKFSYSQNSNLDNILIKNYNTVGILEASFMIKELAEVYKNDLLVIKRIFNRNVYNRTEATIYCYNVCANFFKDKANELNEMKLASKIVSDLDYDKELKKPEVDWENVYKTCKTCPFGEYPDERFFYFKFSILFMGKEEIKKMIDYNNGQQWKYALLAIKGGDSFALSEDDGYAQYILDRRIATYIIDRWKDSKIPEIQKLIETYKSVM